MKTFIKKPCVWVKYTKTNQKPKTKNLCVMNSYTKQHILSLVQPLDRDTINIKRPPDTNGSSIDEYIASPY
ncbi:hypothetical protein DICPUDRAFT_146874 [Dictyostelium purpureum]|uniref:Uncharacterized protein n=1 Tax=Dictyostelium purpureum TaxID=5786 RepID=F0Z741_DICPU|nr:uncharacterized protein DICPUDRAFT_146874 [Dictyostelium purpureum]EGC40306.1 hypothetical protein DICPUDRAFT_146874 [Dictyostelium purpureum]|eukprot:XP_003283242.1 hypothetical protein DICPUDRAFT_146874 [Dictyostelium purpureum]